MGRWPWTPCPCPCPDPCCLPLALRLRLRLPCPARRQPLVSAVSSVYYPRLLTPAAELVHDANPAERGYTACTPNSTAPPPKRTIIVPAFSHRRLLPAHPPSTTCILITTPRPLPLFSSPLLSPTPTLSPPTMSSRACLRCISKKRKVSTSGAWAWAQPATRLPPVLPCRPRRRQGPHTQVAS